MGSVATARELWGADVPAWVLALAEACDATSMSQVGKRLGYTKATVSQVIRNQRRPGSLGAIEAKVRAELLAERVACPVLGDITLSTCLDKQALEYANTNSMRVQLWRACQGCERNARNT